jgi:hypothetical protein
MIIIIISLLFALYMFWHFNQRRKIRKAAHQREKREALINLLTTIRKKDTTDNDNKTEKNEP